MKKITAGYVLQEFNDDGKCVSQGFIASDQVNWEDETGKTVNEPSNAQYCTFDMIQP